MIADSKNFASTAQCRARNSHQAHRANAHHKHGIAVLHIGQFRTMKAGRHHIAQHHGFGRVNGGRQQGQVAVRIVNVKKLAEHAVLKIGKFPAREHAAGMHGIPGLRLKRIPVWRNCGHDDLVPRFKATHQGTNFHNFANRLVSQNHVVPVTQRALPNRVDI